jgi:hypothetical protein
MCPVLLGGGRRVPRHQMIARAWRASEGYFRTRLSMGVSNGRGTLYTGVYPSRGGEVRGVVILCIRVCQNPGRAARLWGRSIGRLWVPTCSISMSSGVSMTAGMAFLLSPRMLSLGCGAASCGAASTQALVAGSGEGQSSICLSSAFKRKYTPWRHKRKTNCFYENHEKY